MNKNKDCHQFNKIVKYIKFLTCKRKITYI